MKSKKYGKILAALLCAGLLAGWHAPPVFAATVGDGASATGANSIAIGNGANAAGKNSVAIGENANNNNTTAGEQYAGQAVAIGTLAKATGDESIAVGYNARATQLGAVAYGSRAFATHINSVAIGYGSQTTKSNTVSFGRPENNNGSGAKYRNLEGIEDVYIHGGIIFTDDGASAAEDLAQGELLGVSKINGIGLNYTTDKSGAITSSSFGGITFDPAANEGKGYVSDINQSIIFGENGKVTDIKFAGANGEGSTVYGQSAKTEAEWSTAVGNGASTRGKGATAVGYNSQAYGDGSTAIGYRAQANHNYSTAVGHEAYSGFKAAAFGYDANAEVAYSTALGSDTYVKQENAVAVGYGSGTSAEDTVSFGDINSNNEYAPDYRNLEGIKDVYVSGGINFTNGGVGNNEALEQGEMLGVTSINGKSIVFAENGEYVESITVGTNNGGMETTIDNAGVSIADKTVITDSDVVINKGTAGEVSLADVGQRMTVAENRIDRLGKEVDEVGALGAALAGLHPMDTNSRTDIAVALGSYDGNQAVALGAFYRPDKRTMLSVGASATDSRQMFNMGVSFALDKLPDKPAADSEVLAAVMARLEKLEAENAQLRAQYAELKEQTAQQAE